MPLPRPWIPMISHVSRISLISGIRSAIWWWRLASHVGRVLIMRAMGIRSSSFPSIPLAHLHVPLCLSFTLDLRLPHSLALEPFLLDHVTIWRSWGIFEV